MVVSVDRDVVLARVRKRFPGNRLNRIEDRNFVIRIMKARAVLAYARTVEQPEEYRLIVNIQRRNNHEEVK